MHWYDWFFGPAIAILALQPMFLAQVEARDSVFRRDAPSLRILWLVMVLATALNAFFIGLIFFSLLGGLFLISIVLAFFSIILLIALYEWHYMRRGLEAPWDPFSMLVFCVFCITACWILALPYIWLTYTPATQ